MTETPTFATAPSFLQRFFRRPDPAASEMSSSEGRERLEAREGRSGLDEKAIAAILKKEKIKQEEEKHAPAPARATYTRMSLQYLSLETLYFYDIEFERDPVGSPQLVRHGGPTNRN